MGGGRRDVAWTAGGAAGTALAATWITQAWGGAFATLLFTNLLHLVAPLVAAAAAWRRAMRLSGGQAHGWRWLALAAWTWALGQAAWMVNEFWLQRGVPVADRVLPFPYVSDFAFLAFCPFVFTAILLLPQRLFRTGSRIQLFQESSIIAATALLLAWVTFLHAQATDALHEAPLAMAILLAYPAGDLSLTILALLAALHAHPGDRRSLGLIAAGTLVMAVADAAFFRLAQDGSAYLSALDVGWPVAFGLFAAAALQRPGPPTRAVPSAGAARFEQAQGTVAIAIAVGLCVVALAVSAASGPDGIALALGTFILGCAAWRAVAARFHTVRLRRIQRDLRDNDL